MAEVEEETEEKEGKARICFTLSQEIAEELRDLKSETNVPISKLIEMHFTDPAKYALLVKDFLGSAKGMETEEKDLKLIEKLLLTIGVDRAEIKEIMKKIEENTE